ncbi:hypothetical protein Pla163_03750 [Planctomycetes bacterium Pla163]|uniref:Uncharacterized protein n=1 Tax=Rohdeia mirabilis TaxID=2528008 RepID=A0A518CVL7_9BACT|nr:hypothetical protein Pla163_03750 [Planctomycetes bacterium Pla163]
MTTLPYTASLAAVFDHSAAGVYRALPAAERARIDAELRALLYAGVGKSPSGPPWTGEVTVIDEGDDTVLDMQAIAALQDELIDDWNSKYDLKLRVLRGEEVDPTWKWAYIDGVRVRVPNDWVGLVGGAGIDPFALLPDDLGENLSGQLRIQIAVRG